jgi:dTDP-4-dehydrorhamnose 3,5-epimerase
MELTPLGIEGAWLAESPAWNDDRGYFREWFKREEVLSKTGIDFSVQQANVSQSRRGVIRGIHYSLAAEGQSKWVTCVTGAILEVIVDIRPNSPTYKQKELIQIDSTSQKSLLVGSGLGHGFVSLSENSTVSYLLSSEYNPMYEHGVNFFDQELNINVNDFLFDMKPILSEKDSFAPNLMDLEKQNLLPMYNQSRF